MRQIVLLRGINLGARNRVSMPELRTALERDRFDDVQTYLQSGNVVLASDASPEEVAERCRRRIARAFKLQIDVVTRTRDELAAVVKRDPLGKVASDPKRYQVSFLACELDAAILAELAELAVAPERLVAIGRELYAWHPRGVARSKLWARLADRRLGVPATARNWTTVTKLLELADA
jgi:uncharacterized protein (DUF1697 family)